MYEEAKFNDFLVRNIDIGYERRVNRAREDYLVKYKERFIEFLLNLFIIALEYPKNFKELESLVDDENKEMINIVSEAFKNNFAEALCSIKHEIPKCLLDEYSEILIKLDRNLFLNDAKQYWYKEVDFIGRRFNVTERRYAEIYDTWS